MKWKNVLGLGVTFLVFVLLFSLPASVQKDSSEQVYEQGTMDAQRIESDSGPSIAAAPAESDQTGGSQDRQRDNKGWNLILSILLLSAVATFLSWTVVDRVLRDKSHVELVSFTGEQGKRMMDVLSNETCRKIVEELGKEELTASELAERLDMSVQRVHYNLKNLKEADMVKSDHFKYSERGKEMDVYSLAKKYFVIAPEE